MSPSRRPYSTDLSDREWAILEPLIPPAKPGGRPRSSDMPEILNGIFYVLRSGCAWRLLPHEFPPWSTVYHYFQAAWRNGVAAAVADPIAAVVEPGQGKVNLDDLAAHLTSCCVRLLTIGEGNAVRVDLGGSGLALERLPAIPEHGVLAQEQLPNRSILVVDRHHGLCGDSTVPSLRRLSRGLA